MKKPDFIKKPFLTVIAVVVIAAAIFYLQSQKLDIGPAIEDAKAESDENSE